MTDFANLVCGPSWDRRVIDASLPHKVTAAVFVSGGADSAVLLYLLALQAPKQLTIYNVPNPIDGANIHSNRVVEKVNQLLRTELPKPVTIGDTTLHYSKIIKTPVVQLLESKAFDRVYTGDNQIPPKEHFDIGPMHPRRTWRNQNAGMFTPFLSLYKFHILDLANQFGISDLLSLTHSCTMQSEGSCGNCWQDKERLWAQDQLAT